MKNMKKLNIAAVATAACILFAGAANAEDLVFTLKNGTNSVLTNFYTSPVGVNEWEDDVFGKQVLNPGESMDITIADGRETCKYDMKFEFEEGSNLDTTTDTQNLCEMSSYTIHE
ncbi:MULTISPECIES: hypothetical protein [Rhizobium]|nr:MULTISPECIES: hypothetical protein [Rhizobium]